MAEENQSQNPANEADPPAGDQPETQAGAASAKTPSSDGDGACESNPANQAEAPVSTAETRPKLSREMHLWEYRWVRDLLIILAVVIVGYILWQARSVLLPVVLAMALAYVLNPLVKWLERKGISRFNSSLIIVLSFIVLLLGSLAVIVPLLINQIYGLVYNVPSQFNDISSKYDIRWDETLTQLYETVKRGAIDFARFVGSDGKVAAEQLGNIDYTVATRVVTTVTSWLADTIIWTINLTTYVFLALVIVLFCFFYFSWRFDAMVQWLAGFVPPRHKVEVAKVAKRMDRAIAAWFRSRLLQSLIVAVILCVGWYFCGLDSFLVLGLIGGALNFIPYAAVLIWPVAIALMIMGHHSEVSLLTFFGLWYLILAPTLVYVIAQINDNWVVEPILQGQATDLDPVTVLIAVLIGGALAGFLGLLLAIPTAACLKILATDVILPRARQYVQSIK